MYIYVYICIYYIYCIYMYIIYVYVYEYIYITPSFDLSCTDELSKNETAAVYRLIGLNIYIFVI